MVLTVSPTSSSGFYTLIVNNLRDLAVSSNLIVSNSTATLGYTFTIPIEATWRFFTNNTDLGTSWRSNSYNDAVAPWASGQGLIADEDCGCLPEPIRTPISRLDNGTYHYTFYFRYHFTVPPGITTGKPRRFTTFSKERARSS